MTSGDWTGPNQSDQPRPTEHAEQLCNDGYPHAYAAVMDERRFCEGPAGHDGSHWWQQYQWPQHAPSGEHDLTWWQDVPAEQMTAVERAYQHQVARLRAELAQALRFREMQDIALRNHTEQISVLMLELQKVRPVVEAAKEWREANRWRQREDNDEEGSVLEAAIDAMPAVGEQDAELQKARVVVEAARTYRSAWWADDGSTESEAGNELDAALRALDTTEPYRDVLPEERL